MFSILTKKESPTVTRNKSFPQSRDGNYWIYKCNSRQHPNQVAFGDWNDFFQLGRASEWGSTEWVQELRKAQPGDTIIAYQTNRNELVGLAKVKALRPRGKFLELILSPIRKIGAKVRPLKLNPKIAAIPALQPGPVQTLYKITAQDAKLLLRTADKVVDAKRPKSQADYAPTADERLLQQRVSKLRKTEITTTPVGQEKPATVTTTARAYVRDPLVKAWVLQKANGRCEGCRKPAPFTGDDGEPFLECHHVRPLADGGSDRISNAVALCPNCHRCSHQGANRKAFTAGLYAKIRRLVRE